MFDATDAPAAHLSADESFDGASRERADALGALREIKMARSTHAYVRGSTASFYRWLKESGPNVPRGPDVWICGDCHVGNLGPLADARGRVRVEIRDFDQAVIGNPAHDLIRLGLSLTTASQSADLPGVTAAQIVEALIRGYEAAMSRPSGAPGGERPPKMVQRVLRHSVRRRWKQLATERLENPEPNLPLGKHFLPLLDCEQRGVRDLLHAEKTRRLVTMLKGRDDNADIEVMDAAYWIKGCSSLGRLRYAAIIRVGGRKGELCLVDIKEAAKADAPRAQHAPMPLDNAERVVAGARALSPSLGERMFAAELLERSVFVRELLPQDLKIEIEALDCDEAQSLAQYLAHVVGESHARQMKPAERRAWKALLAKDRHGDLDAPGWLWSSVLDLVALHEPAYLEHCRRHVLSTAV